MFCLNPLHISRSTNWVEKDGKFLKTCAWWKKESTDTWATITAKEYTTWHIMVHVGHEGVSKIEPSCDESTIYCLHQYFPVCNLRVVSHLFLEINISCNRKKKPMVCLYKSIFRHYQNICSYLSDTNCQNQSTHQQIVRRQLCVLISEQLRTA